MNHIQYNSHNTKQYEVILNTEFGINRIYCLFLNDTLYDIVTGEAVFRQTDIVSMFPFGIRINYYPTNTKKSDDEKELLEYMYDLGPGTWFDCNGSIKNKDYFGGTRKVMSTNMSDFINLEDRYVDIQSIKKIHNIDVIKSVTTYNAEYCFTDVFYNIESLNDKVQSLESDIDKVRTNSWYD